jgi:hypothetical protein
MWAIFMNSTAFNFVSNFIRIKPAPEYYEAFLSGRPGQQRAWSLKVNPGAEDG